MEAYTRVPRPRDETPIAENEVRIKASDRMRSYIEYSLNLFNEKGLSTVVLKAMGKAISKTVSIAEVLRRRVPGLHQLSENSTTTVVDEYEPKEEGLDRMQITRELPVLAITLSTEQLDSTHPGYLPPLPPEQVHPEGGDAEREFMQEGRGRGRPRHRRGRGRGRGRGAGAAGGEDGGEDGAAEGEASEAAGAGEGGDEAQQGGAAGADYRGRGRGRGRGRSGYRGRGRGRGGEGGGYDNNHYGGGEVADGAADGGRGGYRGGRRGGGRGRGGRGGRGRGRGGEAAADAFAAGGVPAA